MVSGLLLIGAVCMYNSEEPDDTHHTTRYATRDSNEFPNVESNLPSGPKGVIYKVVDQDL